jgi:hypothetical protein
MGNNHDTTAARCQVVESVTESPNREPTEPGIRREPAS